MKNALQKRRNEKQNSKSPLSGWRLNPKWRSNPWWKSTKNLRRRYKDYISESLNLRKENLLSSTITSFRFCCWRTKWKNWRKSTVKEKMNCELISIRRSSWRTKKLPDSLRGSNSKQKNSLKNIRKESPSYKDSMKSSKGWSNKRHLYLKI